MFSVLAGQVKARRALISVSIKLTKLKKTKEKDAKVCSTYLVVLVCDNKIKFDNFKNYTRAHTINDLKESNVSVFW